MEEAHQDRTIFVSIPSYRDPELVHTVRDLYSKAHRPEAVYVGICWQLRPEEDQPQVAAFNRFLDGDECIDENDENNHDGDDNDGHDDYKDDDVKTNSENVALTTSDTMTNQRDSKQTHTSGGSSGDLRKRVRIAWLDWREAKGPCHARCIAQSLYAGEQYHLALDSHMRFIPGWDTFLIELLARCPSAKPVLTAYPAPYLLPNRITDDQRPPFLCAKDFGPDGILRICGKLLHLPLPMSVYCSPPNRGKDELIKKHSPSSSRPLPSLFWASGFSFSSAALLKEVPYDPHLPFLFFGEEISMAARMWTHGWDFFSPPQHVIYHLWTRDYRPTFWEIEDRDQLKERSLQRIKCLLGILSQAEVEPESTKDIDFFGLGQLRSLEQFQQHLGVNFKTRKLDEKAQWGGLPMTAFVEGMAQYALSLAGLSLNPSK